MHNLATEHAEPETVDQVASKRRWWQFSLRSLLIVMSLVAVALGLFMQRVRTQKQAVAEIRNYGGQVTFENNWLGQLLPELVKKQLGENACTNAVSVSLRHRTVNRRSVTPTDAELDQIVDTILRLPHATQLTLSHPNLKDDDLAKLAPLRNRIEKLFIKELFHRDFQGNKFEHLNGWVQLQSLYILSSSLEGTLDLQPLASLPNLTHLTIGTTTLDKQDFRAIANIESLQTLTLYACRFDGELLKHLQRLPNLDSLTLHNTHAEAEYRSYTIDKSGNKKPRGKLIFRFERTEFRHRLHDRDTFPKDEYDQWLQEILPNIKVGEWFSS